MPIKMDLKQRGVHFVLCPKQGTKIEGVVINRVCVLGIFFVVKGVRVPNAQRLTSIQISVDYPPTFVLYIRLSFL